MKTLLNKIARECGKSSYQGPPDNLKNLPEPVTNALKDTLVSPTKVEQFPRGTTFKPMFNEEQKNAIRKLEEEVEYDKNYRSIY